MPRKRKTDSYVTKFWSLVKKADGCWLWQRPPTTYGYGQFWFNGKTWKSHRLSYALVNGGIGSLCVLHSCDVRLCCNPAHLWLGTRRENSLDMASKGRAAHNKGNAKIDQVAADTIRLSYPSITQAELSRHYKLSKAQVCRIVKGERWVV